jgi:aquaporin Z
LSFWVRSDHQTLFAGSEYIGQLWLFWIVPLLGAAVAGLLSRLMYDIEPLIDTIVVEDRSVTGL